MEAAGAFSHLQARHPGLHLIGIGALLLGMTLSIAALMPTYRIYALSLFPSGVGMTF